MALSVFRFGAFELNVEERLLVRDGHAIPLTGKVFDTLRVLVENAGRLVLKDELIRTVWAGTVVEENNLNHNISLLRKALGESATGQAYIETVPRMGYRFVAPVIEVRAGDTALESAHVEPIRAVETSDRQQIRFCTAPDGVRIAYSAIGSGYPLVKAANWLNHLEFEWKSPIWRHWIEELSRRHLLIRYDERGNGLSDWNAADFSFDAWLADLESVVEAAGPERFALLGISQGGAVAAAYAARHPERVKMLKAGGRCPRLCASVGAPRTRRFGNFGPPYTYRKRPANSGSGSMRCSGSQPRRKMPPGFSKNGARSTYRQHCRTSAFQLSFSIASAMALSLLKKDAGWQRPFPAPSLFRCQVRTTLCWLGSRHGNCSLASSAVSWIGKVTSFASKETYHLTG